MPLCDTTADSQIGSFIYAFAGQNPYEIQKIDSTSFKLINKISLPFSSACEILAVNPAQSLVYLSRNAKSTGTRTFDVVSTATDTITGSVDLALPNGYTGRIAGLVFSKDGSRAFVSLPDMDAVMIVSSDLTTLLAVINTGSATTPFAGTLSPDGAWLYVPLWSNRIAIINTAYQTLQGIQPTFNWSSGSPQRIVVSPDGNTVYVSLWNDGTHGTLLALQTTTNHDGFSLLNRLPMPEYCTMLNGSIALTADGGKLYAQADLNTVPYTFIVDTKTYSMTQQSIASLDASAVFIRTRDGNRIIAAQCNYFSMGYSSVLSLDPAGDIVSASLNLSSIQTQNAPFNHVLVDTHPACLMAIPGWCGTAGQGRPRSD